MRVREERRGGKKKEEKKAISLKLCKIARLLRILGVRQPFFAFFWRELADFCALLMLYAGLFLAQFFSLPCAVQDYAQCKKKAMQRKRLCFY